MVIILSPFLSFCLSTSMCAPVTSWMAVMLQPPRPMMRETTEAGTESLLDLQDRNLIGRLERKIYCNAEP